MSSDKIPVSAGLYVIKNYPESTIVFNSWGGGMESGQALKLYPNNEGDNEKWTVVKYREDKGQGAVYLVINSRNGYYLYADKDQPAVIKQVSPENANAHWRFLGQFPENILYLSNVGTGQNLAPNGPIASGTPMVSADGVPKAVWTLTTYAS